MITHSCDVCAKTSEPATNEVDGFRAQPLGWFRRSGRIPHETQGFHEIVVMCCSPKCCAAYDKVEAEKVGFSWMKILITPDSAFDPTQTVRPLKVRP